MQKSSQLLKTEIWIALILRVGVIISGLILAFALVWGLVSPASHQGITSTELTALMQGQQLDHPNVPLSAHDFSEGFKAGNAGTIMALGLILLIALPALRVAFTVILFIVEKDHIYTMITLIVLAILVSGLIFGKAL